MGENKAYQSSLFAPLKVGPNLLSSRIAMAPLTRCRANDNHVHQADLAAEYYSQRATVPGTLLITEGTMISPHAGNYANVPGIWNKEQTQAWKQVVEAVHRKGSFIWLQLWSSGRAAISECPVKETGNFEHLFGPSQRSTECADEIERRYSRELNECEIAELIQDFTRAAKNAVDGAGFDGVEILGANGYIIDQFIQDVTNRRTDSWGGSIENRSRFALAVARSVAEAVGADRVGFRLSPWGTYQGMRMEDPVPQFSHVIEGLRHLGLAYLHLVEAREDLGEASENGGAETGKDDSNERFLDVWGRDSPVLLAGGFSPDNINSFADGVYKDRAVVFVFGRCFLSTPDLVFRLKERILPEAHHRETFYHEPKSAVGYVDYPFSKAWTEGRC